MIRRLLFFILYYSGISFFLRKRMIRNNEISVLLFHRICDNPELLWPSMPIYSFKRLTEKINETCQIISFSELQKMEFYSSKPIVIISFDDGYIDFYENVLPIIKSLNIKCNHNICPGLIENSIPPWTQILSLYLSFKTSENESFNLALGIKKLDVYDEKKFISICKKLLEFEDNLRSELILPLLNHIPKSKVYKLMNWNQIKECSENQVEIGSHGNMHRNLLKIWEPEILENEITLSSRIIESKIGSKPKVFAFANAMGNDESKKYVLNSGYQFTLINLDNFFKWEPLRSKTNIEVPRINISRYDWREEYLRALGFHALVKRFLF